MTIEQVRAYYEGAKEVTKPSYNFDRYRKPDLKTIKWDGEQFRCDVIGEPYLYISLWDPAKGFTAEITQYRELKVGDTVELNGIGGVVKEENGSFHLDNFAGLWNYPLLGVNSVEEGAEISERILGYSAGGRFPACRTLEDLSKLYWTRKYELSYPAAGDVATNNKAKMKKLIGYNWKEEKYIKAFSKINGDTVSYLSEKMVCGCQIGIAGPTKEVLDKEGLLDLWTVPVYQEEEKVFVMGFGKETFEVVVRDGKAYHGTDDITEFVRGMFETLTKSFNWGGYRATIDLSNTFFVRTGCQSKKTSYDQWAKVYDALNL